MVFFLDFVAGDDFDFISDDKFALFKRAAKDSADHFFWRASGFVDVKAARDEHDGVRIQIAVGCFELFLDGLDEDV